MGLGFAPHAAFSSAHDVFAFFKNAFDEDTYALYPLGFSSYRLDRMLSGGVFVLLKEMAGGSYDWALVASDVLWTPAACLAAYYCACALFQTAPARVAFALALAFAADLITLGNSAMYAGTPLSLVGFRSIFGAAGQWLVPPYDTSFLTLMRSPDPQASLAVAFLVLGQLVRMVRTGQGISNDRFVIQAVFVQSLLSMSYAPVSYPLIATQLAVAVLLMGAGRHRDGWLLVLLVAATAAVIYAFRSDIAGAFFQSHLPVVTPSVLLAAVVFAFAVAILVRRRSCDPSLWLVIVFAAIPLGLTNQQVLTGVMVSARDWERFANPYLAVTALALLLACVQMSPPGRLSIAARHLPTVIASCIAFVVTQGAVRSFDMWRPGNEKGLAMARAATAAAPKLTADTLFVLDEPGLAPQLAVRTGGARRSVLDYTKAFVQPIRDWRPTPLTEDLFEWWRRRGITPEKAEEVLVAEAAGRGGYFSGFLFPVCQYWYPCTDNRAVRSDLVEGRRPEIVAAYRDYLLSPSPRFTGRDFVLVTSEKGEALAPMALASPEPIGEGRAGAARVAVYRLRDPAR